MNVITKTRRTLFNSSLFGFAGAAACFTAATAYAGGPEPLYLYAGTGVTVALGESMGPEPFANRTTESSLASVIDLDGPQVEDPHGQSTHVWVSGSDLELDFDLGSEHTLTRLYFWNYTSDSYDVDIIDMVYFDSSGKQIGDPVQLTPREGQNASGSNSNPIVAEPILLEPVENVRFINMFLRGSNSQVDFQNIGFESISGSVDPICVSDLDGDGDVDSRDLSIMLADWGTCP